MVDRFNGDDESYILYLLEVRKRVSNAELCQALNLSSSTVRKKLAKMEDKGLLIRTHGGAISTDSDRDETLEKKLRLNIPQKKAIASVAAQLFEDGKVLSFGGGSTILELIPFIRKLHSGVVLTNSTMLTPQIILNSNLEVNINGGIVRGRTGCVVGTFADQLFRTIKADKAFIGCDSFNLEHGAESSNILVGKVEQCMLENAKERYILCDSTKLNQYTLFSIAQVNEITALITDDMANPDYINRLRHHGLKVIVASIPSLKNKSIFKK